MIAEKQEGAGSATAGESRVVEKVKKLIHIRWGTIPEVTVEKDKDGELLITVEFETYSFSNWDYETVIEQLKPYVSNFVVNNFRDTSRFKVRFHFSGPFGFEEK